MEIDKLWITPTDSKKCEVQIKPKGVFDELYTSERVREDVEDTDWKPALDDDRQVHAFEFSFDLRSGLSETNDFMKATAGSTVDAGHLTMDADDLTLTVVSLNNEKKKLKPIQTEFGSMFFAVKDGGRFSHTSTWYTGEYFGADMGVGASYFNKIAAFRVPEDKISATLKSEDDAYPFTIRY